jgi:hypothetical protein
MTAGTEKKKELPPHLPQFSQPQKPTRHHEGT